MNILNSIIHNVKDYMEEKKSSLPYSEFEAQKPVAWEKAESNNIILLPDLGAELGHPDLASVSFLTWTSDKSLVEDNKITIIGPDIHEASQSGLPFGKVVIAEVEGFDEHNAVDRNREMYLSKFDISLQGFMLKSASAYMAEWCRISKEAVHQGFSLEHIGSAMIQELKKSDYVKAVEVLFVTSSKEDVNQLYDMGNRSVRTVNAMSKMVNEMSYDCGACEFQDICDDAEELKNIRDTLEET